MKTDRLYALTLYLLNHGKSSASELAKHFEVSVRTIQRDIDALCQAGIPICAFSGTNGGYEILQDFKMNNQLASEDEYAYIATAINGLKTVTNNPMADDIYEKIIAISKKNDTGMILDFSVLREGDEKILQILQSAVKNKLVRMEDVCTTEDKFSREHMLAEEILNDCDNSYQGKDISTRVKMRCRGNAIHRIKEYLNGQLIETFEDGSVIMEIHIVETEQWWIGVVLSQGDEVEVVEPEHIKERIIKSAKDILFLYEKL